MSSEVTIANMAVVKVGTKTISDIDEDTEQAATVRVFFDSTLETELRTHPWSCAVKRAVLAHQVALSEFGELYVYPLPVDCLRVLVPENVDWVVEGRSILTADADGIELRYVAKLTDLSLMDAALRAAFVLRLAVDMCEKLAKTTSKKQLLMQEYADAITAARKANAFERVAQSIPETPWLVARL